VSYEFSPVGGMVITPPRFALNVGCFMTRMGACKAMANSGRLWKLLRILARMFARRRQQPAPMGSALRRDDTRALQDTGWHPATAYETDVFIDEIVHFYHANLSASGK